MKYCKKSNDGIMKFWLALVLSMVIFAVNTMAGDAYITVNEALNESMGRTVTIRGYITGNPVSGSRVKRSDYSNDYAIALGDNADETNTQNMIYIKLDKAFRSEFGLKSNPEKMGEYLEIKGRLDSYFGRKGLKYVSKINLSETGTVEPTPTEPTDPTPTEPTEPTPIEPPSTGEGIPEGYYKDAVGKTGAVLKNTLNDIIDNHKKISYKKVWEALRETDEDPSNSKNVILLYSGKSLSKFDNGGGVDEWNREHVWAKSHGDFGTRMGAGTDLHHLRPTDVTVNSSRSNLNFDESDYPQGEAPGCYIDSDSFEPRDEVKGDVARMIFYMAVRYEGERSGEPDLEVSEWINDSKTPFHGKLSTLLKWHKQDPVSQFEKRRNNIIYSKWQGNRNPFIDNPQWVEAIWN